MFKKSITRLFLFPALFLVVGCTWEENAEPGREPGDGNTATVIPGADTVSGEEVPPPETVRMSISTKQAHPDSIVAFARTQIGVPYLYASIDPAKGFDCSGFITYVFTHFNIAVPRSSVDFTDLGKEIDIEDSKPGDIILFTGTDSTIRVVGHMGIIESTKDEKLYFIHSTSGKAKGVVITPFENYYRSRFVKVIRIFPDEYFE